MSDSLITVEVSAIIADLMTHAAKENSRYAINGILVERINGTTKMVATDGHRLAIVSSNDAGPDFSFIIETDTVKRAAIKARHQLVELTYDPGTYATTCQAKGALRGKSVIAPGPVSHGRAVEGNFPPYADVMKNYATQRAVGSDADIPGGSIWLNPVYLANAAMLTARLAARHGDDGESVPCVIRSGSHRHACEFYGSAGSYKLQVICMPVNGEPTESDEACLDLVTSLRNRVRSAELNHKLMTEQRDASRAEHDKTTAELESVRAELNRIELVHRAAKIAIVGSTESAE